MSSEVERRAEATGHVSQAMSDVREYAKANWPELTFFFGVGISLQDAQNGHYHSYNWDGRQQYNATSALAAESFSPVPIENVDHFLAEIHRNRIP